jgi:hypothetical protein
MPAFKTFFRQQGNKQSLKGIAAYLPSASSLAIQRQLSYQHCLQLIDSMLEIDFIVIALQKYKSCRWFRNIDQIVTRASRGFEDVA